MMTRIIKLGAVFMLAITIVSCGAQKKEIQAAKKAIKNADFVTALSSLKQMEGTLNADEKKNQADESSRLLLLQEFGSLQKRYKPQLQRSSKSI